MITTIGMETNKMHRYQENLKALSMFSASHLSKVSFSQSTHSRFKESRRLVPEKNCGSYAFMTEFGHVISSIQFNGT